MLTDRQAEVARLAGEGLGYREIGRRLGISRHTVRSHVNTIACQIPSDGTVPALRLVMRWALSEDGVAVLTSVAGVSR